MYIDVAVFKSVAHDRMEMMKKETYGSKAYKSKTMKKLKKNMLLLVHNCI